MLFHALDLGRDLGTENAFELVDADHEPLQRPLSFVVGHARICFVVEAVERSLDGQRRLLFVIIGHDSPEAKELRPKLRPSHLAHLETYHRAGRVKLSGPLTDGAGSLIVIAAADIAEAKRIADADPYVTGGVFAEVEIHPFMQVFPPPESEKPK